MEQTVTQVRTREGYYDPDVRALSEHVQAMSSDGWLLVSTESGSNGATTTVLFFWRKE